MRQHKKQRRPRRKYQKRKQRSGFLNRYDFAYAIRSAVNQVGKIAPGLIYNASSKINYIAQQRINQIISQGGKEVERVLPNIYETPFRLIGKFGKQQLQILENTILR